MELAEKKLTRLCRRGKCIAEKNMPNRQAAPALTHRLCPTANPQTPVSMTVLCSRMKLAGEVEHSGFTQQCSAKTIVIVNHWQAATALHKLSGAVHACGRGSQWLTWTPVQQDARSRRSLAKWPCVWENQTHRSPAALAVLFYGDLL